MRENPEVTSGASAQEWLWSFYLNKIGMPRDELAAAAKALGKSQVSLQSIVNAELGATATRALRAASVTPTVALRVMRSRKMLRHLFKALAQDSRGQLDLGNAMAYAARLPRLMQMEEGDVIPLGEDALDAWGVTDTTHRALLQMQSAQVWIEEEADQDGRGVGRARRTGVSDLRVR